MFEGQPKGFPFGDFDLADVMLPENDDMGIPSDSDEDGQEEDIQTATGFGNVLGARLGTRMLLLVLQVMGRAAAAGRQAALGRLLAARGAMRQLAVAPGQQQAVGRLPRSALDSSGKQQARRTAGRSSSIWGAAWGCLHGDRHVALPGSKAGSQQAARQRAMPAVWQRSPKLEQEQAVKTTAASSCATQTCQTTTSPQQPCRSSRARQLGPALGKGSFLGG